jgi:hypothetical protein
MSPRLLTDVLLRAKPTQTLRNLKLHVRYSHYRISFRVKRKERGKVKLGQSSAHVIWEKGMLFLRKKLKPAINNMHCRGDNGRKCGVFPENVRRFKYLVRREQIDERFLMELRHFYSDGCLLGCCDVWSGQKFTDVSEVLATSIIRTICDCVRNKLRKYSSE